MVAYARPANGGNFMASASVSPWLRWSLVEAGLYNLAFGASVVLFPHATSRLGGLGSFDNPLKDAPLWQCIGMIVGVYGFGYWIASRDPVRHWPIVLIGLIGKVLGP